MRHKGWKVVFGLSWIPAILLYGALITCLAAMGGEGAEVVGGGFGFIILLIPSILVAGLQVALGFLAFRK